MIYFNPRSTTTPVVPDPMFTSLYGLFKPGQAANVIHLHPDDDTGTVSKTKAIGCGVGGGDFLSLCT